MGGRLLLAILAGVPRALTSRLFGRIADLPLPTWLRAPLLGGFARLAGARVDEAELPLANYPSLNAFFVRRLAPGTRVWPDAEVVLASPVDGVLAQHGTVENGRLLQAKGRWYSAADLLGGEEGAEPFMGGLYAFIYLAPRHYHRIHAPCAGTVARAVYVPGTLLPVNAAAVAEVPDLLASNERIACFLQSAHGRVALVAIGAYNVGRISTVFDPTWHTEGAGWVTNRRPAADTERHYDPSLGVERGQEIMAFHLGSSVVLMLESGTHRWVEGLIPGQELHLGAALAEPLPVASV